jgi:hypothetical protein
MGAALREHLRLFGLVTGAVFALGLPLVLNLPSGGGQMAYAMSALIVVAGVCGAAIAMFLLRPNRPFSLGSAPAPAAAAAVRSIEYSLDTRTWSLALLKRLEWRRFEEVCAAYFEMAGTESRSMIVHCRATSFVGIKPVRALRGVMAAQNVAKGHLVTSGQFTREARDFAAGENIALVSGAELLRNIAALAPEQSDALLKLATQGDFVTPTCPSCDVKMVPRTSTDAGRKFWGCINYPRCKQTFFSTHNAPT